MKVYLIGWGLIAMAMVVLLGRFFIQRGKALNGGHG